MKRRYKLCLSMDVVITSPTTDIAPDEEALLRLQSVFDLDDHGRADMHGEGAMHHLEQAIGWALMTRNTPDRTTIQARLKFMPATEKCIEPLVTVDCFLTTGDE